MARNSYCVTVVLLFSLRAISYGMDQDGIINTHKVIDLVNKVDGKLHIVEEFATERISLSRQLIQVLSDTKTAVAIRIRAARLLGILRASEAVDVLVANIRLGPDEIDDLEFGTGYPCGQALIDVGTPARKAVIARLTANSDEGERNLLVLVLTRIEGYDVAEFLIGIRRKEVVGQERENLDRVLEVILKSRARNEPKKP